MNRWKKRSRMLAIFLIIISAIVSVILMLEMSAWPIIILYWVVLTGKNACDYMTTQQN